MHRCKNLHGEQPVAQSVMIDETEIPLRGKDDPLAGGQGRSPQGKMFVAGAVELLPDGHPRRIRLAPIADFTVATLRPFVAAVAAPGARVVTDGACRQPQDRRR